MSLTISISLTHFLLTDWELYSTTKYQTATCDTLCRVFK